jgi:hypothetical protein
MVAVGVDYMTLWILVPMIRSEVRLPGGHAYLFIAILLDDCMTE